MKEILDSDYEEKFRELLEKIRRIFASYKIRSKKSYLAISLTKVGRQKKFSML